LQGVGDEEGVQVSGGDVRFASRLMMGIGLFRLKIRR
jgi:hypothetical protein